MADENKLTEEHKLNTLNEFNLYANDYDTWIDQWQDPNLAEDILIEKLHRLNGETEHMALAGENEVTDIVAGSMENIVNKTKSQRTKADYALLKAPIRGAATIWNGLVFLGREAWDYENWIKSYERIKSAVDGDPNTDFWKIKMVTPSGTAWERFLCNTTGSGNDMMSDTIDASGDMAIIVGDGSAFQSGKSIA